MLDDDRFLLGLTWWVAAFGVPVYQCYGYLKTGIWEPISINDTLVAFGSTWAEAPVDWIGLHNVFNAVPISVLLFAVSFVLLLIFRAFFD